MMLVRFSNCTSDVRLLIARQNEWGLCGDMAIEQYVLLE